MNLNETTRTSRKHNRKFLKCSDKSRTGVASLVSVWTSGPPLETMLAVTSRVLALALGKMLAHRFLYFYVRETRTDAGSTAVHNFLGVFLRFRIVRHLEMLRSRQKLDTWMKTCNRSPGGKPEVVLHHPKTIALLLLIWLISFHLIWVYFFKKR